MSRINRNLRPNLKFVLLAALTLIFAMGCARSSQNKSRAQTMNIINGELVTADDALIGSTVAIYYIYPDGKTLYQICTGTVIGKRSILTAGHCILEYSRETKLSVPKFARKMRVAFGLNITTRVGVGGVQLVAVKSAIVHPDFDMDLVHEDQNGAALADIAVLQLTKDIPKGAKIIPLLEDSSVLTPGTTLTSAGFGYTQPNPHKVLGTQLEKADVTIDNPHINPDQFSFLVVNGISPCNGDSGGPAYWTDPNGQIFVAGAFSWGDTGCSSFAAYTSVPVMLAWIRASM